jgi:hypothetical protein
MALLLMFLVIKAVVGSYEFPVPSPPSPIMSDGNMTDFFNEIGDAPAG